MILLPFDFKRLDKDNVLIINVAGEIAVLTINEFEILHNEDYEYLSTQRIRELKSKHFITEDNSLGLAIELLANKLRSRKDYLAEFTSLHMIVLTLRCNCRCSYCHASSKVGVISKDFDMSFITARNTVDIIFKSPSKYIKIEFQGGEPTLNFEVLKYIVLYAEEVNKIKEKILSFVICTNLIELSEEQLVFLKEHRIDISTSCDGNKEEHDYCRKSCVSNSAFDSFYRNLGRCRDILKNNEPSALLTITKNNINKLRSVIDCYRNLGFNNVFIRALNPYGYAIDNKMSLGYSTEEFVEAYKDAMEYIIEINLKKEFFVESYASIILQRILTPFCTGFVDLQSPSGDGISGCIYYYNGNVYPADEGRMLAARGDERFLMGNVNVDSYESIFDGNLIHTLVQNSCVECLPGCATCAYKLYCGADPIRYYVESNDIIGKRYNSGFCKKNKLIIELLLSYIAMDNDSINKIFWSWINKLPSGVQQ